MILFGAAKRYIEHLEQEVELLRAQVFKGYRAPSERPKRENDPPPESLVRECAKFDTHGPRLLAEAQREHVQRGTSWDEIEARIKSHIAQHAPRDGEAWAELNGQP